jgi:peptidoglycan/xylan/chitin deacetylase (PgdA/CDA1 family)
MEDFFATHPNFGHTAFFGMLPIWCFDYEAPDQTPYCDQKLTWLHENGYEIGNHTWDHQDLSDQSNEVFKQKIADTSLWIEERVPEGRASRILILPYGVFPSGTNSDQQWKWIRKGWDYEGQPFKLTSVVAAGANPAYSPSSIEFDVMSIARIGAKDDPLPGEADLFFNYWFAQFEANPELLYTSDGHPDTVTFPAGLADSLDEEKAAAEGKQVIEY